MQALRPVVLSLAALVAGCVGGSQPAPPDTPSATSMPAGRIFVAERSYEDVRKLVAIGPRTNGSAGAARAREYLRGQLEKLGLTVDEAVNQLPVTPTADGSEVAAEAPPTFVHLSARIPGRGGSGEILLAASYDTAPAENFVNVAANGAASGPAVVLELARVLAAEPLDYDTRVAFVDGDQGGGDANQRVGSRLWARDLRESGEIERIRLAMTFRQVCDPDLSFERDLFSNRAYREVMWRAARRGGHSAAFPPGADFGTPSGIHHSLIESGMRRVVAVVDDSYGGTEPPGALAGTAEDDLAHCSAESLGVTGTVALETLVDLTHMLSKVDRLSPEEEIEPEEPGAVPEDSQGAPDAEVPTEMDPPAEPESSEGVSPAEPAASESSAEASRPEAEAGEAATGAGE